VFTLIFVGLFVAAWLFVASIPWFALSIATRGRAGLANLPFCLFAGFVGGLAIPVLGKDDAAGIWLSMVAALAASALILAARRASVGVLPSLRQHPAGESHRE